MAATYTLSGDPKTLLGSDDFTAVRAYITCDQDILVDPDGVEEPRIFGEADVILANATTNAFSVDLPGNDWTPSPHWYTLHIEGRSRTSSKVNRVVTTAPFQMTADTTLADLPQAAPKAISVQDYESLIEARDEAVAAAESVTLPTDGIIAGRINDPESATAAALSASNAQAIADDPGYAGTPAEAVDDRISTTPHTITETQTYRKLPLIRPTGAGQLVSTDSRAIWELNSNAAGSLIHLTSGPDFSGPYLLGLGVDHATGAGAVASVKGGGSGLCANLETTSTSDAEGFYGQQFSSGRLLRLVAGATATGPLAHLENNFGGTGNLLSWDTNVNDGRITPTGNVEVTGTQSNVLVRHADTNPNQVRVSVDTGATLITFNHYAGSSLHYSTVLSTSGTSWRIRKAAPAALGAETYSTMMEFGDTNKIGVFGVTPVVRQSVGAAPTDAATALTSIQAVRSALIALGWCQP